jgi:hypothetical protein
MVNSQGIRSSSSLGRLLGATINPSSVQQKHFHFSQRARRATIFPLTGDFFAPFFDWKITLAATAMKVIDR